MLASEFYDDDTFAIESRGYACLSMSSLLCFFTILFNRRVECATRIEKE